MYRKKSKAFYERMLKKYPDVMSIPQMSKACDVSSKTGYKLLKNGDVTFIKIGRNYRIPKAHIISYLRVGNEQPSI